MSSPSSFPCPHCGLFIAFFVIMFGIFCIRLSRKKFEAIRIDFQGVLVAGCGEPFLQSLPTLADAHAAATAATAENLYEISE